ncbi:Uncharacterised protein [Porphyromonas macacae]|uniref:Uncharacterized protein n=1 Tax=Porphyromonas macacae TaxID=28115 RepID=A0A379DK11_9PORP|nr:Uncharacterised protein [Porphyromonas macacae]
MFIVIEAILLPETVFRRLVLNNNLIYDAILVPNFFRGVSQ